MNRPAMLRVLPIFCACLALSPVPAAVASETLADYAGSMAMTTLGSESLHRIELPQAVYAGVRYADLRDLRVFNAAQEPLPYALVGEAPVALPPRAVFAPPVFGIPAGATGATDQLDVRIEQRADGSVVSIRNRNPASANARVVTGSPVAAYIVDATRIDSEIAAVRPEWREVPASYVGSVRVEASDNLRDWRTLVAGAPLAYLTQGQARLVQDRIEFAPIRSRYFRLVFSPAAPALLGLAAEAPSVQREIRRQTLRVAGRTGDKPGEFEFDLGSRAPVDRVRLVVPQSNALAPVRLEARPDARGEWRPVVSTVAYRMVRDGQELASPAVAVAPNASPRWRAVVDQTSGGLGDAAPELEVSWPARGLVFVARGQGPYTLAFGRADATPVRLPLATLVPGYRDGAEGSFPVAEIGPLRTGSPPSTSMLPQFMVDSDLKKVGLWMALVIGVLVLAAMAWRLSRQMKDGAASSGDATKRNPPTE